jgi:hypothetical protein
VSDDQVTRDEVLRRLAEVQRSADAAAAQHMFGSLRLRPGGHWGRTLVAQGRYEPPDAEGRRPGDRLVGMVDTSELAAEICRRWNGEALPPPLVRDFTTDDGRPF